MNQTARLTATRRIAIVNRLLFNRLCRFDCLTEQRHFDALLESQTVVAQSFNAQPEAPARSAGASGWALNVGGTTVCDSNNASKLRCPVNGHQQRQSWWLEEDP